MVEAFLQGIGVGETSQGLTPAQVFLAEVTYAINQLATGPSNELTSRLFLLDQLPATRVTLSQFVERAFTDPALADEQASLRQILSTMTDADVATVFDYLASPLQVAKPDRDQTRSCITPSSAMSPPHSNRIERTIENAVELEIPEARG